jgi:hypothetical protein
MALIKIKGSYKTLEMSDEEALKLKNDIQNKIIRNDEWVEIGDWHGKAGDIKSFDLRKETETAKTSKEYDLDNPMDKDLILNFEREMKKIAEEGLKKDLSFYGEPCDLKKYPMLKDFVSNPILSMCHFSEVEYCLRKRAIGKKGNDWFVAAEEIEEREGGTTKVALYNEYRKLRKGLDKLKERRNYAKKMEGERLNIMDLK